MKNYKNAEEFLNTYLSGNLNIGTLTPYGIVEVMEAYLKAMKEDKSEYPKLMYVGDTMHEIENDKLLKKARYVFYKDDYGYWAYIGDNKIESIEKTEVAYRYKYAQDIEEEKPEPKKEVIDITIPNLENVIVTINGKEVDYKLENNNIILEP